MPQLIKGRTVVEDRWTLQRDVASLGDLAEGVQVIVPLAFWLDPRNGLRLRGDIDALPMWAGQGVGLVKRLQPAGEIVREIDSAAQAILTRLGR